MGYLDFLIEFKNYFLKWLEHFKYSKLWKMLRIIFWYFFKIFAIVVYELERGRNPPLKTASTGEAAENPLAPSGVEAHTPHLKSVLNQHGRW